jgi:hypothetical protein
MPLPKSVKRRMRAQMGRGAVHSYVVVVVKGGLPLREQVGEEVVRVVETDGYGCSCWCRVVADCC